MRVEATIAQSVSAPTGSDGDIVVVGSGPAGLAVSACLRTLGLPHTVLDRDNAVAGSWRRHYRRLHLHTIKRYSALPGAPWSQDVPRYPSRQQVVDYLTQYADRNAVKPRFGVEVCRIRRQEGRFCVDTSSGALQPRFVVVATGYNGVANRPEWPGLEHFTGPVVHSCDYQDPLPFAGKRTLVAGCGNSGAEIALDLAEHAVEVTIVLRGPVHVVPRDLFGRPSQQTSVMLSRLPVVARDAIVGPILRLAVGDLSRWGIVRPKLGPNRMIEEQGRVPLLDVGTIAMVKAGRIRVRPGVREVSGDLVQFADGSESAFDAIVLATGYKPGLERFIDGFAAISDARGRPHRFGAETAIPGLFFVGFRNPPTGALREIGLEAPRVAAAIAAALRAGAGR